MSLVRIRFHVEPYKNLTVRCVCNACPSCGMILRNRANIMREDCGKRLSRGVTIRAAVYEYMLTDFLCGNAVLYLMTCICAVGVLCRALASARCKRLLREASDLILARDRGLKQLRVRFESAYRLNHGEVHSDVLVKCHMADYRFLGTTIERLEHADRAAAFLCMFLAISGSGFLFIRETNMYICARVLFCGLSLSMATLLLGTLLGHNVLSHVCTVLTDYLDHSLSARLFMEQEKKNASRAKTGMRDDLFMQKEEAPIETSLRIYQDPISEIAATVEDTISDIHFQRPLSDSDEQAILDVLRRYLDERLG